MSDANNIVQGLAGIGYVLNELCKTPVPTDDKIKAKELRLVEIQMGRWEGFKEIAKEKESTFTAAENEAIKQAQIQLVEKMQKLVQAHPEKAKFLEAGIESGKKTVIKPGDAVTMTSTDPKAQGDKDGKKLEKQGTEAGSAVNEFFTGAKKAVTGAIDDAKNLFNADGTKKTDAQIQQEKDDAAAAGDEKDNKDKKDKGFFDKIGDWFKGFNGKDMAGGAAGGILGYMLGKMFGEGTLGTIAGILMSLGGAVMGRNFAHDHFNGDDKGDAKTGGKTEVGANAKDNVAANGTNASSAVAVPDTAYKGMTDEQLKAALEIYNRPVVKPKTTLTQEDIIDYAIAHPVSPNLARNTKKPEVDDLYGR